MPVPVISVAQMREWEKLTWAAGRTQMEVISRVGHVLTTWARHQTRPGDAILVLAGKGHNGDDARQVAQNLTDREVTLLNVREPAAGLREFKAATSLPQSLIVEGLFGIGLKGTFESNWTRLIQAVNESQIPVVAVDVPAGLDADTGQTLGTAIRATWTLTLGAPKRGLLTAAARPYVGRLEVAPDIGLVACPHSGPLLWTLPEDFDGFPPRRPVDGHKGTFGHLVIVAGSRGYHGAAVLATRAALRAQPGLVTLVTTEDAYLPAATQLQSAMVQPWTQTLEIPPTATAVLFGPGLAAPDFPTNHKDQLAALWKHSQLPIIVDASGLDWLPPGKTPGAAFRAITPHPGEAARMLRCSTTEIQVDRAKTVSDLSRQFGGTWVVLKGFQTAVGRLRTEIAINPSGNPELAQGGSGDALAGYLAGLLAQPALQATPASTLRYAVWQHGHAADLLSRERPNWTIEELTARLGLHPATSPK